MGRLKGYKHTEETKQKIREKTIFQFKNGMPEETRKKLSILKKGKHYPKLSEAKKGKPSGVLGKHWKLSEEIRRKMSEVCKGEKAYNWIKDRTQLKNDQKRNDSAYQEWVKQVKKRDNNTCKINNEDCSGYCIVHHILRWSEYPEERYNINNGITLCQYHHPRKRIDEQKLISIFQKLVIN